jgi:dTDP-4-amino-4,6-dideoxygalactose transaminase
MSGNMLKTVSIQAGFPLLENMVINLKKLFRIILVSKYAIAMYEWNSWFTSFFKPCRSFSNDIVIAPNLTFVATLNAISYSGAQIAVNRCF